MARIRGSDTDWPWPPRVRERIPRRERAVVPVSSRGEPLPRPCKRDFVKLECHRTAPRRILYFRILSSRWSFVAAEEDDKWEARERRGPAVEARRLASATVAKINSRFRRRWREEPSKGKVKQTAAPLAQWCEKVARSTEFPPAEK